MSIRIKQIPLIGGDYLWVLHKQQNYKDYAVVKYPLDFLSLFFYFIRIFERKYRDKREHRIAHKHTKQIIARDGRKCKSCGTAENITIDHVIPLSKGGFGTLENLMFLCYTCNQLKGNRL